MHYRYFTLEQRDHLEQAMRDRASNPTDLVLARLPRPERLEAEKRLPDALAEAARVRDAEAAEGDEERSAQPAQPREPGPSA